MRSLDKNFLKNRQAGFSTLEVLLAMVILILALTAVVLVSFGNQSLVADSTSSNEALTKAQALLEEQQAKAFSAISSVSPVSDGVYTKRVDVVTPWNGDGKVKHITASVNWTGDRGRAQQVQLSALSTDYKNP